jgi:hypothetical protein
MQMHHSIIGISSPKPKIPFRVPPVDPLKPLNSRNTSRDVIVTKCIQGLCYVASETQEQSLGSEL